METKNRAPLDVKVFRKGGGEVSRRLFLGSRKRLTTLTRHSEGSDKAFSLYRFLARRITKRGIPL
jgi:hypothetical protein